jgi:hypothetical protein
MRLVFIFLVSTFLWGCTSKQASTPAPYKGRIQTSDGQRMEAPDYEY